MVIDILPVWALFLVTLGVVILAVEAGFRIGRIVRGKAEAERESPAASISGVVLGLLAFMLGFTFSIASDRYDNKRALMREEANTIRTAFHRADFLAEPDRVRAKALIREYVDQRVAVGKTHDAEIARSSLGSPLKIQKELWDIAVANGRLDMNSDVGALLIESVNEIAKVHAERVSIGIQARIPTGIWLVLVSLLLLGIFSVGYHTAIADSRRSRVMLILGIAFSLVIALIAALDHPLNTLVPVSQQPLQNLQAEMLDVR